MKKKQIRETILFFLCVLLAFGFFYLMMLDKWGINPFDKQIDYVRFGTWSQALSGIGTTSAVIVALASLYWQRTIRRSDENRRLLEEETAIFLWLNFKEIRNEKDVLINRFWDVKIQNSTVAPIYRWKVTFTPHAEHLCNYSKRPLLPGENLFNLRMSDNCEPEKLPEPVLIFEGRTGRFWSRTARGVREEVTAKELDCEHTLNI